MKKIALLTCKENPPGNDDCLLIEAIEKSPHYNAENIPWDEDQDWSRFDKVIIRTTWDYTKRINEFLDKMKLISSKTQLLNPLATVVWNHHKGYLKELQEQGVFIVPTIFFTFPHEVKLDPRWTAERFILKPCVSAGAYNTMIVTKEEMVDGIYRSKLFNADWMLQPFIEEIFSGEISLHFFDNKFSHAIIKVPKLGDFRVQEEYGSHISPYTPSVKLLELAQNILSKVQGRLLFARVDVVEFQGSFALMELELIEPSLYFGQDPESPERFLSALDKF